VRRLSKVSLPISAKSFAALALGGPVWSQSLPGLCTAEQTLCDAETSQGESPIRHADGRTRLRVEVKGAAGGGKNAFEDRRGGEDSLEGLEELLTLSENAPREELVKAAFSVLAYAVDSQNKRALLSQRGPGKVRSRRRQGKF